MTSEATDESGVNAFMLALAPGIGRARRRFGPKPSDANEPNDIGQLKTGRRTAIESCHANLFTIPLRCRQRNAGAPRAPHFGGVCAGSITVRHPDPVSGSVQPERQL